MPVANRNHTNPAPDDVPVGNQPQRVTRDVSHNEAGATHVPESAPSLSPERQRHADDILRRFEPRFRALADR